MRVGYRARVFLATFGIAAAVLLIASTILAISLRRQTYERIERGLISEARLAAELLSHRTAATSPGELQNEARALGRDSEARVTLISADGQVVGDSSQDEAGLATLENHAGRPEVVQAAGAGLGIATRSSATLGIDMLYVAARVRHPAIATVRLALPLTEIRRQLFTIWRAALYALAFSVAGAFALAWLASNVLARRLGRLADVARGYAAGQVPPTPAVYGDDEVGMVAKVLDDSVKQLAQRAADLARDRARREAILAGMVEGVLELDASGRVQLANEAARRILRLEGEPVGRHYVECVRHPAVLAQLDAVMQGARGERVQPAEVREGARVFVARAAPASTPEARGAVLVLHDVTDLHRALQIRRDFVANVSHELRTPLTAMRGYVEALEDGALDAAQQRDALEVIARQTARMERLAHDLLRLARLDAGEAAPQYTVCRLEELFAAVVTDLRTQSEDKRQRIEWTVEPGVDLIRTDAQQLQDALRNLVENAIVYSPPGGLIELAARRDGDRVVITVADHGPGIPPSDLTRIFERFYRVDKARSQASGGTGLGLSIVRHIVEGMAGSVRAENRRGGGAIFTIELRHAY